MRGIGQSLISPRSDMGKMPCASGDMALPDATGDTITSESVDNCECSGMGISCPDGVGLVMVCRKRSWSGGVRILRGESAWSGGLPTGEVHVFCQGTFSLDAGVFCPEPLIATGDDDREDPAEIRPPGASFPVTGAPEDVSMNIPSRSSQTSTGSSAPILAAILASRRLASSIQ